MNDCFVFKRAYAEALMNLPDNDSRFKVLGAIFDYVFNGTETDAGNFTALENMILMLMKPTLDMGIEKLNKQSLKVKMKKKSEMEAMLKAGASQSEVAKTFNVSPSSVCRLAKRLQIIS